MFKFIKFYMKYRKSDWYVLAAFSVQMAMADKEEFVETVIKYDTGKIERVTYKLHSVEEELNPKINKHKGK